MEIRILRYFLEIAREGSMTRAAERLLHALTDVIEGEALK